MERHYTSCSRGTFVKSFGTVLIAQSLMWWYVALVEFNGTFLDLNRLRMGCSLCARRSEIRT
jgi:hypothetical protein